MGLVLSASHQVDSNGSNSRSQLPNWAPQPGKNLGVDEFSEYFTSLGLSSCFDGLVPDGVPSSVLAHTTFNARTFLQPQLNKAIKVPRRRPLTVDR